MFNEKTKYRNQIILFISSYFPLYLIILVQNISSLFNKCTEIMKEINLRIIDIMKSKELVKESFFEILKYPEIYMIGICLILIVLSYFLVRNMLEDIKNYSESSFIVKVLQSKSLNYEYVLTYFSIYIFPFITLNLSSFSGIIQFFILWLLVGYVYVKNSLVYINPLLNIVFKYNIYNIELEYDDDGKALNVKDIILITKKEKVDLGGKPIRVIKETSEFYIEIEE